MSFAHLPLLSVSWGEPGAGSVFPADGRLPEKSHKWIWARFSVVSPWSGPGYPKGDVIPRGPGSSPRLPEPPSLVGVRAEASPSVSSPARPADTGDGPGLENV